MKLNRQYNTDCRDGLEQMITNKQQVDCVITSPPYYLVRDYKIPPSIWGGDQNCNHDFSIETINIKSTKNKDFNKRYGGSSGQKKQEKSQQISIKRGFCSKCNAWLGDLGNEPNISLYISHLCDIFDLVKKVLKDSGSCWVNIADTYSTQGGQNRATNKDYSDYSTIKLKNRMIGVPLIKPKGLPPKCLMLIPFRFAIEMVDRGWIHRQTVIWEKGNPMPSSVVDNFAPCYEYFFWFVKNSKKLYWTNKKTLQSVSKKPLGTKGIENIDWKWKICTKCEGKGFIEEGECPSCKGLGKRKRTLWKSHDYYFEQQREGLSDNPATQERYKYKVGNQSNRKDNGVKLVKPGKAFSKYFPKNLEPEIRGYKTKPNLEPNPQHHGNDIRPILSGRNMRNVWHINVGKSSEPHFAQFPEALMERPIRSTTPKFICSKCGLPKVKIIKAEGGTIGTSWHNHKNDSSIGMSQKHSFNMEGYTREFVGYSNCGCNTTKFIPGIVLDPFAGLGNALKKAWDLGRDFIGFDISKRYCQIFEKWNRNRSIRLDDFISGGIK